MCSNDSYNEISIFHAQTMPLNVGIPNGKLINISKSLSSKDVHRHVQTYDIYDVYGHLRDNSHEFFSFISRVGKPLTLIVLIASDSIRCLWLIE